MDEERAKDTSNEWESEETEEIERVRDWKSGSGEGERAFGILKLELSTLD